MTYRFNLTQYGSTWYHSHWSLQYAEGLFGPLIINGPTTADWDEDLGLLFLQDWDHKTAFSMWDAARQGAPPTLVTGLINGTNTWNCSESSDPACIGGGKKFEMSLEAGKKYLLRVSNVAIDGHFHFSIDGHNLTVIGNDLVPIVPYTTDAIYVSIGQRYDVIVEANATPGNYWLRAGWVGACSANENPDEMTGIIRYDASSTQDPSSTSTVGTATSCLDEPVESLVPHVAMNVTGNMDIITEGVGYEIDSYFKWTINTSSLYLDWANPTLVQIFKNESVFPTDYNVVALEVSRVQASLANIDPSVYDGQ